MPKRRTRIRRVQRLQILCETGLLPGALLHNESRKFICKNVTLKPVSRKAPVSSALDPSTPITIPIAHGEGNYFIDDDGLKSLQDNDQVLFQYCDESGAVNAWSNPNGAVANIAGVANREMNVFGMMPHRSARRATTWPTPTARPSWRA